MIRFILVLLCLCTTVSSCGQKTVTKEEIIHLENVQKVANIYKDVKEYDYDPQYTLEIEQAAGFSFEFLVNDLPILNYFKPGMVTGSIPINEAILKSGEQTITVRMTPPVKEDFFMKSEIDMSKIDLRFKIDYGDYTKEKTDAFKDVFKYEMPKQEGKLPYYEVNLTFDAPIVAYEDDIIGLESSVDLSKENKEELFKEVESFYKEMINLYGERRDVDGLAGMYYKRLQEFSKCYKMTKAWEFQEHINHWIKNVNDQRPFIFSGYEMKFYGNGKIVKLAKMDDRYYINKCALMREDEEGNATEYKIFLHRPYPGAPLEIIR